MANLAPEFFNRLGEQAPLDICCNMCYFSNMSYTNSNRMRWLLFFYSVPARPVNARVKIWRTLARAGAVQLRGAVYVLPHNEENYELCQWLVLEVSELKGEGMFVTVEKIETMSNKEITSLFNAQRDRDYGILEDKVDEFERKVNTVRKGTGMTDDKKLTDQFARIRKEFDDIGRIDFFRSKRGTDLKKKIEALQKDVQGLTRSVRRPPVEVTPRNAGDYKGRIWATRKRPFVDRMASAWLVRNFIDKNAKFTFIDEKEMERLDKAAVAFDIRDGEFTHSGDMCTFEVLMKTFGLRDRALSKMAEIVHELDMKDEKYSTPEAKGIENILAGIRKTSKNDIDVLEKGMEVFEMLYVSKT